MFKVYKPEKRYELYTELFEENEALHLKCTSLEKERFDVSLQNRELVDQVIGLLKENIKSMKGLNDAKDSAGVNSPTFVKTVASSLPAPVKQPKYYVKKIPHAVTNLILGSSIVATINLDDLPGDIMVHTYKGSSTNDKMEVIDLYPSKKLTSFTIQDGTVSLHQNPETDVSELFEDYKKLIQQIVQKFTPAKLFLCHVPPVNDGEDVLTSVKNIRIKEFNDLMQNLSESTENFDVIPLFAELTGFGDIKKLYRDELHPNNNMGMQIIKNCLSSKILKCSSGVTRVYSNRSYSNNGSVTNLRGCL